ncbi:MAG TPA: methyltransferase domain-containing protein [Bryobacteraceae bacterium]|nr:methyltransferase domain-containing protein [Bryobacteraceae bacterium]
MAGPEHSAIPNPLGTRFQLQSGERQVTPNLSEIRRDHRARYEFAVDAIRQIAGSQPGFGADVFCGVGYGSQLLATELGCPVLGIDGSGEAIEYANRHYATSLTLYSHKIFPFALPAQSLDFIAAFESIEHVADDRRFSAMLTASLRPAGILILSTPNQRRNALEQNPNAFHVRHYDPLDVVNMIQGLRDGMVLRMEKHQNVYRMAAGLISGVLPPEEQGVCDGADGQFSIFVFQKSSGPATSYPGSPSLIKPIYANFADRILLAGVAVSKDTLLLKLSLKAPVDANLRLLLHGYSRDASGAEVFHNWDRAINPPLLSWQVGDSMVLSFSLPQEPLASVHRMEIGFFDEFDTANGWPPLRLTSGEPVFSFDPRSFTL